MLNLSIYYLIKLKIAALEYLPGSHISESQLIESFKIPRNKIREALAMLAQDNLIRTLPQKGTEVLKIDLEDTLNSIFILKAFLIQILKDLSNNATETEKCAIALEELLLQDGYDTGLSNSKFYYMDNLFYTILSKTSGYTRVTQIISREKSHIERVLRLSLKDQADFEAIQLFNQGILEGIQSKQLELSIDSLLALSEEFSRRALLAKDKYPYFFTDHNPHSQ